MKIKKNIFLKNHTTFKIGGKAEYFLEAKSKDDIIKGIKWAQKNGLKYFILGWGSNVLFSEKGFNGLIIKNSIKEIKKRGDRVYASSGILVSDIIKFYIKNSFAGFEWAGGLPGTLGGGIRGNAGCFGGEMKDIVDEVISLSFDKKGNLKISKKSRKACKFGYRHSIFKENNEIILGAYLKFKKGDKKLIREKVKYGIEFRRAKHPMEYPSAGSFFKNIPLKIATPKMKKLFKDVIKNDPFPIIPAADIIDKGVGLKGKMIGGAEISSKMPVFIVNKNNASYSDVLELIKLARKEVYKKFKIELEEEVRIVE